MKNLVTVPPFIKYFFILASVVLTCFVIVISRPILNPVLAALIFAFLLRPLSTRLEIWRIPRILSTIFAIVVVLILLTGLSLFFSSQVETIAADANSLVDVFNGFLDNIQHWTTQTFGIAQHDQVVYLKDTLATMLKNSATFFRSTLSATAGFFTALFFFFLVLFFFLYYRGFFAMFFAKIIDKKTHHRMQKTLLKIQIVVGKYIVGLLLVIFTMAALNVIGLFIIGIKHALFFGTLAAVLTIIPYIGILVGSLLPMLFALATMDSLWYPFAILILFTSVQFLEGNFITPNIVGNQVSINPFAAIIGLLIAGMLLGIVGVIVALPLLAIIKVICDEVEELKPIGFLLGNPPKSSRHYRYH